MLNRFLKRLPIFCSSLLILLVTNSVWAQYANNYVYTTINYDQVTDTVNASIYAAPDYNNYLYFRAGISAAISDGLGNSLETKSVQTAASSPILNFQTPGNGCGNYKIAGGAWMLATYYVYQMYGWDGNYHTGYYVPYNYFDSNAGVPAQDFFYRQGPGPIRWTYDTFMFLGTIQSFSNANCVANDVKFTTVSSSSNGAFVNFDPVNYNATVDISGGQEVCGTNRVAFNLTVNFELPFDAVNISDQNLRTYVSDSENQQFQALNYYFENVNFSTGKGRMIIYVRRTRPDKPSKRLGIRIEGNRATGPNYFGTARVNLICP